MVIEKKPVLLFVDDEPLNIKLFEAIFVPLGYGILSAQNGIEAWDKVQSTNVDAVLLDVMIPGINGFELCKLIRENRLFSHIPIVFVTSLTDKKFRVRGIEAGADDFLIKPIDKELLVARINTLIKLKTERELFRAAYESLSQSVSRMEDSALDIYSHRFDFNTSFDPLVCSFIGQTGSNLEKPQFVLWGADEGDDWRWIIYEFHFAELIKKKVDLPLQQTLEAYLNRDFQLVQAVDSERIKSLGLNRLTDRLEAIPDLPLKISNLVGYVGKKFCIFALNYPRPASNFEGVLIKSLAVSGHFLLYIGSLLRESTSAMEHMIMSLTRAGESTDANEKKHPARVGEYCAVIARKMGLNESFIREIRLQAMVHDIGNLLVPPDILHKAGKLSFEEWDIIRLHPVLGKYIIGDHPRLEIARTIALTHHENWDGTGYPNWLEGERIPVEGRIAAIADRYDALRVSRPYKSAMDHKTACSCILEGDERLKPWNFDPAVLDAFKDCASRFAEIFGSVKT